MISVIICTIRRAEILSRILTSIEGQSYRDFEVLIVGGDCVAGQRPNEKFPFPLLLLSSPPGLSKARNVGLAAARGDVLCFLDDDVELSSDFLNKVAWVFSDCEMKDVGGITGYDTENYPHPISLRWKLRLLLGLTPSLQPGDSSKLGRSVPFSFFQPFHGFVEVRWLPGFCQIFRRNTIAGMRYDEYAVVEDREFSLRVGDRSRLLIWGDLTLAHKQDEQARPVMWRQTWRAAFGLGHSFMTRSSSWRDWLTIIGVPLGELLIDMLVVLRQPSVPNVKVAIFRMRGYTAGLFSARMTAKVSPAVER